MTKTMTEWIEWLMEPGGRGIEEGECRELAALLRAAHEPSGLRAPEPHDALCRVARGGSCNCRLAAENRSENSNG